MNRFKSLFLALVVSFSFVLALPSVTGSASETIKLQVDYRFRSFNSRYLASVPSTTSEQFETVLVKTWTDFIASMNIASLKLTSQQVFDLYYNISYKYPQLFYIGSQLYIMEDPNTNFVTSIHPIYSCSKEEYEKIQKPAFDKAVDELLDLIDEDMLAADKALLVHDYITLNNKYDPLAVSPVTSNLVPESSYSAYGTMVMGVSVCQGISEAFMYIMRLLGFECEMVVSDPMNHAWNIIKIGNDYFQMDATWDEGTAFSDGKLVDLGGYVLHDYFLVSDKQLSLDHYDWVTSRTALSEKYASAFWVDVHSAIYYIAGYQYYISASGNLVKRNAVSGEITVLYKIPAATFADSKNVKKNWGPNNSRIAYDFESDYLFFSTSSKVLGLDIKSENVFVAFDSKIQTGAILGLGFNDQKLYYDVYLNDDKFSLLNLIQDIDLPDPVDIINFGDINDDGKVNAKDVLTIRKWLIVLDDSIDKQVADVNVDGEVNAKDVLMIRQKLAGFGVVFGSQVA